jgi:hypothetical protein
VTAAFVVPGPLLAQSDPTATPATEPSPAATSARAPDDAERKAMKDILSAEKSPDRKAWVVLSPGEGEPQELERALRSVFEEAGWKVETQTITGMVLKPGVAMLAADEEPPLWVGSVQRALDASGLPVKYGSGYRPYYEEMKSKNPKWVGVPIAAGQVFVIVLGPEPSQP